MTTAQDAFNKAIKEGRLSTQPSAANYADNYMYMGTNGNGGDLFKHTATREYLFTIVHPTTKP